MKSLFTILFVILFISCGSPKYEKFDKQDEISMEKPDNQAEKSDDQVVQVITFETIKDDILEKNCISCHPQYSIYSEVFNDKDSILDAVLTDRMPKKAEPLQLRLKNILSSWVESGAPKNSEPPLDENDNNGDGDMNENVLEANWTSISKNIFFPKCVQCHNQNGEGKFLDLSSIDKIRESKGYLIGDSSKAEESLLYEVITDPFEPMPPPRSGLDRLNQDEIDVIVEWIKKDLPI